MREMRDPQNGCQIGTVPLYGYDFSFNTGTIRIETIMYSELHQPPKIKVKRTIN